MKKFSYALIAALSLSLLAGCGNKELLPDYSEYVVLGDYQAVEYVAPDINVYDYEIDDSIDAALEQTAQHTSVDRAIEMGDYINMDYVGSIDGVEFDGGSTQGAGTNITVGEAGYIDDFEEQLVGHKAGENFDIEVTFPENYGVEDLNGKDAIFNITINAVMDTVVPEFTDVWVADNTDYDTTGEYRVYVEECISNDKKAAAVQEKTDSVMTNVVKTATISGTPSKEVNKIKKEMKAEAKNTAKMYDMSFEQFIQSAYNCASEDEFDDWLNNTVLEYMNEKMVVTMIAKDLGYTVNKTDVDTYAQNLMTQYGITNKKEIYDVYTNEDLAYLVIYDRVQEYLVENAVEVQE